MSTISERQPAKIHSSQLFHSRYYCLSILDKHHHPDINFEQGLKILRMCTDELKRRLPIDFKGVCEGFSYLEDSLHIASE